MQLFSKIQVPKSFYSLASLRPESFRWGLVLSRRLIHFSKLRFTSCTGYLQRKPTSTRTLSYSFDFVSFWRPQKPLNFSAQTLLISLMSYPAPKHSSGFFLIDFPFATNERRKKKQKTLLSTLNTA